jgi:hypothetical protein
LVVHFQPMHRSGRAKRIKTIHVIGMDATGHAIQPVIPDGHGGIRSGLRLAPQPRRRLNIAKLTGKLGRGRPDWAFEPSRPLTAVLVLPDPDRESSDSSDVASIQARANVFDDFVLDFVSVPEKDHPEGAFHPNDFTLFDVRGRPDGPQMDLWD